MLRSCGIGIKRQFSSQVILIIIASIAIAAVPLLFENSEVYACHNKAHICFDPDPESEKKGGGGCTGDCTPPTLGMDNYGKRLVYGGFAYNGDQIDVDHYYTQYSAAAEVGRPNMAVFRIYDNGGADNIIHFGLAFGVEGGQSVSESSVMIEWNRLFNGTEEVTVLDPKNILDNISVESSKQKCNSDRENETIECLVLSFNHTFREPPDSSMVGTVAWDSRRNAWQNYFNEGIDVIGESMNPPNTYNGIHNGRIYSLTETGKHIAVDESGNTWTFHHNIWNKDYVHKEKIVEMMTSHGYNKNHPMFKVYKMQQILLAEEKLREMCERCFDAQFKKLDDDKSPE